MLWLLEKALHLKWLVTLSSIESSIVIPMLDWFRRGRVAISRPMIYRPISFLHRLSTRTEAAGVVEAVFMRSYSDSLSHKRNRME